MEQKDYRLAAILYTDIVGFSRMMEADEAETLKMLAVHNALIERIVTAHQGTVIKTIGDAYMVSFRNTVQALQSAIEIQDAVFEYNLSKGEHSFGETKLLLRIGLHLGDIYFYENDALGEGINIAARLQSFAKPGCICFSQDVFNQVLNKIDFHAEKLGRVSLKNITKEIYAYEIETKNIEFDREKTTRNRKIADPQETPAASSGDEPAPQHGAAEQHGSSEQPPAWNFETDGRRLGVELNRAFQGFMSIAERKLNGFITSMESGRGSSTAPSGNGLPSEERWKQWMAEKKVSPDSGGYDDSGAAVPRKIQASRNAEPSQNTKQFSFEDIRLRAIEKWERGRSGLAGHIISYIAVNAGVWFINIRTAAPLQNLSGILQEAAAQVSRALLPLLEELPQHSVAIQNLITDISLRVEQFSVPGFFPWAAFVTFGWGIGLVSNILEVRSLKKTKRELETIDDLPEEGWRIYRRMDKSRRGMVQHTASAFTVSLLLLVINAITASGTSWAAIPCGILFLSWFIRLIGHGSVIRSFKRRLCAVMGVDRWRDLFSGKSRLKSRTGTAPEERPDETGRSARTAEAEKLRDSIVALLRKKGDKLPLEKDTEEVLDSYIGQIRLLSSSLDELDAIIASVPVQVLKRDRIELSVKMRNTESGELKREYGKSIDEIAKQEEAHRKVVEQREALDLRLTSSVHALKRIQMDVLRMSVDSSAAAGESIFARIQQDSDELSQYIEDIQSGYQDTDRYLGNS